MAQQQQQQQPTLQNLNERIRSIEYYTMYRTQKQLETIIKKGQEYIGYARVNDIITGVLDINLATLCVETGEEAVLARFGVGGSRCERVGHLSNQSLAEYLYTQHQTAVPQIYGEIEASISVSRELFGKTRLAAQQ